MCAKKTQIQKENVYKTTSKIRVKFVFYGSANIPISTQASFIDSETGVVWSEIV